LQWRKWYKFSLHRALMLFYGLSTYRLDRRHQTPVFTHSCLPFCLIYLKPFKKLLFYGLSLAHQIIKNLRISLMINNFILHFNFWGYWSIEKSYVIPTLWHFQFFCGLARLQILRILSWTDSWKTYFCCIHNFTMGLSGLFGISDIFWLFRGVCRF
jgi:hypothetical protein